MDTLSEKSYKCVTVILRACKPRNIGEVRQVRALTILSLIWPLFALMEQLGDLAADCQRWLMSTWHRDDMCWRDKGEYMHSNIFVWAYFDLCLSRYWSLNNSVLVNFIMCFAYTCMSLIFVYACVYLFISGVICVKLILLIHDSQYLTV